MRVFLRDTTPCLREFRRKPNENSERLGRQARPGFEPGTSRLPVLKVTTVPLVGPLKFGKGENIVKLEIENILTVTD